VAEEKRGLNRLAGLGISSRPAKAAFNKACKKLHHDRRRLA
jgi:hypothetical protein